MTAIKLTAVGKLPSGVRPIIFLCQSKAARGFASPLRWSGWENAIRCLRFDPDEAIVGETRFFLRALIFGLVVPQKKSATDIAKPATKPGLADPR